jgi:uncharacterized membrane protein (DUF2068 family)
VEPSRPPSAAAPSLGILVIVIGTIIRIIPIVAALLKPTGSVATWLADYAPIPEFQAGSVVEAMASGALIGILIVSVLSIIGLLRRRSWGWTLAIVTAGVVLALNIGWYASGEPRFLSMAVNTIVVFYLSQRDLRAVYGVAG